MKSGTARGECLLGAQPAHIPFPQALRRVADFADDSWRVPRPQVHGDALAAYHAADESDGTEAIDRRLRREATARAGEPRGLRNDRHAALLDVDIQRTGRTRYHIEPDGRASADRFATLRQHGLRR